MPAPQETAEEKEKRIGEYADAIRWYIEHPEAPLDADLREMVDSIARQVRDEAAAEAATGQKTLQAS
jgi:tRNA(Ser,Leu) C12 N-acetylase TAN1